MFKIIDKNILINSDWHLNHKNIWIYEFEKRKQFINKDKYPYINTKEDLELFYEKNILNWQEILNTEFYLDTEYNMLLQIKDVLIKVLLASNIKEYINLGDFLFNISKNKILDYTNTKNFILVKEIFNILKEKWINRTLFIGNHDEKEFSLFYYNFFDKIKEYQFDKWWILWSHFPFNEDTKNFKYLEDIEYIKQNIKVSIHWHTHSNIANESKFNNNLHIKYINTSLDYLI